MNKETLQGKMHAAIRYEGVSDIGTGVDAQYIMDAATACAEIAKNEAIEFAEWVASKTGDSRRYSASYLYSLFKQQEG